MADVSDPEAVRKVREQVRPLCEAARALKARILALQTEWFAGLNATVGTGTDHVLEGRAAEGVADLTCQEVTDAVGNLLAIAAAANDQNLSKPCVRPLAAS